MIIRLIIAKSGAIVICAIGTTKLKHGYVLFRGMSTPLGV